MEKMMLVLDNDTDLMFLERVLKRLKFDVIALKKGGDFSEQLIDHFPDVVFASTLGRNQKILSALGRIKQARGKPKLVYVRQEKERGALSAEQKEIIDGVLYSPVDPFKLIDLLASTTSEDIIELRKRYNTTLQNKAEKVDAGENTESETPESLGRVPVADDVEKKQFGEAIVFGDSSQEEVKVEDKGHEIVKGQVRATNVQHIRSGVNLDETTESSQADETPQSKLTAGEGLDSEAVDDTVEESKTLDTDSFQQPVGSESKDSSDDVDVIGKAGSKKTESVLSTIDQQQSALISDPARKSKYDKICQDLSKNNEPRKQLDVKKLRQLQRAQAKEAQEIPSVKENRKHFLKTLFSMAPIKLKK